MVVINQLLLVNFRRMKSELRRQKEFLGEGESIDIGSSP
jgi:hypothetical protein